MGSPNVMIGGGGGGGGGGSGGGDAVTAQAAAVEPVEGHFVNIKFVDKGGKIITGVAYTVTSPDNRTFNGTLTGPMKQAVPKAGNYEVSLKAITKAEWSKGDAKVGDIVKLKVETVGVESGEKAIISIFIKDANFADHQFKTINSKIDNGKLEEEWELEVDEDLLDDQDAKEKQGGFSSPAFYFKVDVGGLTAKSGLLIYKDFIELELEDDDGNKIKNVKYYVRLPNGGVKEGYLDSNGYAKVENLPPGKVEVDYDIKDIKQ